MTQPRADLVNMIADKIHQADCGCASKLHEYDRWDYYTRVADAVMELFPDVEIRAEFMYRLTYNDGQQKERLCDSLDVARAVAASPANWQEPGQPGEVFGRQVTTLTGPWCPVDERSPAVRLAVGDESNASDLGGVSK